MTILPPRIVSSYCRSELSRQGGQKPFFLQERPAPRAPAGTNPCTDLIIQAGGAAEQPEWWGEALAPGFVGGGPALRGERHREDLSCMKHGLMQESLAIPTVEHFELSGWRLLQAKARDLHCSC